MKKSGTAEANVFRLFSLLRRGDGGRFLLAFRSGAGVENGGTKQMFFLKGNVLDTVIDFSKMKPWTLVFLEGTAVTIVLSLITVFIGSLLGFFLTLMRRSHFKFASAFSRASSLVVRGTPMLVQLYLWLYALPKVGIAIPPLPFGGNLFGSREFSTAVIALGLNSGAYVSEILRGGLDAVDKGQSEAARSLGMSQKQTMRKIIIPQALRVILPGLGNEFVQMIKESSIVSTVGIFDVMYTSNIVKAATFSVFEPLIIVAGIYFILTTVLTAVQQQMERRLNVGYRDQRSL